MAALASFAMCAPADAQDESRFAIGASFSQTHPSATEDRGQVHLGLLWRIGQGHDGWGWAYGLSWYSTRLDTNLSDQRVELGEVHVRPILAGYGYSHRFGSTRVTAQVLGGYAFSSFQLNPENATSYRPDVGAAPVSAHMSNTFVVKPQVSVWMNVGPRVGINVTGGYMIAHPELSLVSLAGTDRRRLNANTVMLKVGAVYSLF